MPSAAYIKTNFTDDLIYSVIPVKICNMDYLNSITRGDKKRAGHLVSVFLTEINEELSVLNIAIEKRNYPGISSILHKLKSGFAILGISILEPVLLEMAQLSSNRSSVALIKQLNLKVNIIFNQAKIEMKPAN
jgi:HPt (histidine-containing phosphotransfer) domain-containing protein